MKSTCFNMAKVGYTVHVIADCVTSYELRKIKVMFSYCANGARRRAAWKKENGWS